MLMPKKNRTLVYENLFKEGVIVVKKDFHSQNEQLQIPNLHVIKTLQSLKSRGYVREQFVWRHYYWVLTNEGIQYLRDYLHLPPEIVPSTLRRQTKTESSARPTHKMNDMPARSTADRENYRRTPAAEEDKKGEAGIGAHANLEFRGGFGRGRRQTQD